MDLRLTLIASKLLDASTRDSVGIYAALTRRYIGKNDHCHINFIRERKSMEHVEVDIHVEEEVVAFIKNAICRPVWVHVVRAIPLNKVRRVLAETME